MQATAIITILTDFGDQDGYVGIMKGVMLKIAPHAQMIDLNHQIGPQDVKQAAFTLAMTAPFFPKGTTHLIVVDPGVGGSEHRRVAVETPTARFVAPDNGVLSYVLADSDDYAVVELNNSKYQLPVVSSTFHGRDIFSPAAAHLAAGVPISELGTQLDSLSAMEPPYMQIEDSSLEGEVLVVDHFGNVRTSIHQLAWNDDMIGFSPGFFGHQKSAPATSFLGSKAQVSIGSLTLEGIATTFSSVEVGQPLALIGSEGGLAIAINQGNAAKKFDIKPGQRVKLTFNS